MPAYDGNGPQGQGPMTGRGMGNCEGVGPATGYGFGFGRGQGRRCGRGMGRGRGFGFNQPITAVDEKTYLENNIKAHQNQVQAMQKRLDELKKQDS